VHVTSWESAIQPNPNQPGECEPCSRSGSADQAKRAVSPWVSR
jgi:hypothetical protein